MSAAMRWGARRQRCAEMSKALLITLALVAFLGLGLAITPSKRSDDTVAIKAYVESRGAGPVPKSWRHKIGKGI
jgi:hypothetical protein